MKTPEQRGPFGAWVVAQRHRLSDERGHKVKQQDVIDELVAQGYPIDAAYYRGIEGGSKKPGRETRQALEAFFGRPAPVDLPAGGQDYGELVGAIRSQTEALSELITILRERQQPDPKALAEALGEALASHLAPLLDGGKTRRLGRSG